MTEILVISEANRNATNSTDICAKAYRATASFKAQNGRAVTLKPALRAKCQQARRPAHRGKRTRKSR